MVDFEVEDNCYVNNKFVGTTVAKKITVNILNPENTINMENKEITVQTGMIINGQEETVPIGNFIIEKPNSEEAKEKTSFTGYDYMIKFNAPYKNRVTYPIEAGDLFIDVCEQAGVEAGNTNFVNSNYMILGNPFTNNEDCRTVLSNIAQLAGGFAKIGRDNKVYIRTLKNISSLIRVKDVNSMTVKELNLMTVKMLSGGKDNSDETIDGNNYLDDFSKNDKWGELNSLVLKISGTEGENTTLQDETSISRNGLTELVIEDNYFLISQVEREKVITPLWNSLKGIEYLPFKTTYYGYPYLDTGDIIYIQDTKDIGYISYVFNHKFKFNGAYSGTLETPAMTKTQTSYKNTVNSKTKFRQVERKIDKINGTIEDVIEEQTDFSNRLSSTIQDVDSITQEVHSFYDFYKEVEGTNEIILEDCLPTNIVELKIKPSIVENIIYPQSTLYPSKTIYPHRAGDGVTIVVSARSKLVSEKTIYPSVNRYPSNSIIPVGNPETKKFQFYFGEPLRIFNNTYDEFQILLDEDKGICIAKVIRRIDYNNGIYTIYNSPSEELIGEISIELLKGNNYIYLEEYTDWSLYVKYIFNNVLNEEYAPRVETNSKIRQTADEINLEVSKKVNQDEVIASINLSPEEAKIRAKKLALEGFTSINGGFTIDENGNASISNGTVKINENGIQMADGASLVGGKGLLSNLQFVGNANDLLANGVKRGNYALLGFVTDYMEAYRNEIEIDIDIPEDFTIEKAYITLRHYPLNVKYDAQDKGWGYARKLKLYYTNSTDKYLEYNVSGSSFPSQGSGIEISNAFGSDGYTPDVPSSTNHKITTATSIDIKEYIKGSQTILYLRSDEVIPTSSDFEELNTECALKSGMVSAVLNIFGYLKLN